MTLRQLKGLGTGLVHVLSVRHLPGSQQPREFKATAYMRRVLADHRNSLCIAANACSLDSAAFNCCSFIFRAYSWDHLRQCTQE